MSLLFFFTAFRISRRDRVLSAVFSGAYTVTNLDENTYEEYRTVKDYFTYEENMVAYSVDIYAVDSGSPVRYGSVNRFVLGSSIQPSQT